MQSLQKSILLPLWVNSQLSVQKKNNFIFFNSFFGNSFIYLSKKLSFTKEHTLFKLEAFSKEDLKILCTTYAQLKNSLYDLHFYYTVNLKVQGVNYKFYFEENKIFFFVGKKQPQIVPLPFNIKYSIHSNFKDIFSLYSTDRPLLLNFIHYLRKISFPNLYTGNGILFVGEVLKLKVGKKK